MVRKKSCGILGMVGYRRPSLFQFSISFFQFWRTTNLADRIASKTVRYVNKSRLHSEYVEIRLGLPYHRVAILSLPGTLAADGSGALDDPCMGLQPASVLFLSRIGSFEDPSLPACGCTDALERPFRIKARASAWSSRRPRSSSSLSRFAAGGS